MQSNSERWRFWTAVRAEMRATWWGRWRWRWLWVGLGVACFSIVTVSAWVYSADLGGDFDPFYSMAVPVAALACWPPAWLGSDLLSLRFTANPDPLREWRPVEFLARFVGRMIPLLGVLLATAGAFSLGELEVDTSQRNSLPLFWYSLNWAGYTSPFLASALCYSAVASVVSSLAKRPRRWLITPLVVIFGSGLITGDLFLNALDRGAAADAALFCIGIPNVTVGFISGEWLHDLVVERLDRTWDSFASYYVAAAISFLTVALLAGLWTWAIAARRYRRSRAVQRHE